MHRRGHDHQRDEDGGDQDEGLGVGQRREELALLPGHGEDGEEADHRGENGGEDGGGHLAGSAKHRGRHGLVRGRSPVVAEHALGHHDPHGHDGADGDGNPREGDHVGLQADDPHHPKAHEDREGKHHADHHGGPQVQHQQHDHENGDQDLIQQRVVQRGEDALDEVRAVIEGDDLELAPRQPRRPVLLLVLAHPLEPVLLGERGPGERLEAPFLGERHHFLSFDLLPVDHGLLGEAGGDLLDLLPKVLDRPHGVVAVACDGDAPHRLRPADRECSPPLRRAADHVGDVGDPHRHVVGAVGDHCLFDVLLLVNVPASAEHILHTVDLRDPRPDVEVALSHGLVHLRQRHVVGEQRIRVHLHAIALDVAADGGDLGDPLGPKQAVSHVPVLNGPQLAEVPAAHRVSVGPAALEGVPEDLSQRGRVGAQRRRGALRQRPRGQRGELLQDAAAGPVEVRPVLEDHVDHGDAEHGAAPHLLHPRHPHQLHRERVGHLVLDVPGRPPGPLGDHDLLGGAGVGQGVHGDGVARHPTRKIPVERRHRDPAADHEQRQQHRDQLLLQEEAEHAVERRVGEWASGRMGVWARGRIGVMFCLVVACHSRNPFRSLPCGEWASGRVGEWACGRRLSCPRLISFRSPGVQRLHPPHSREFGHSLTGVHSSGASISRAHRSS